MGFLTSLGGKPLDWTVIGGLLAGGVIAAPLAAYLVKLLPPRILGAAVGGLIVVTNVDTIADAVGLKGAATGVLIAAAAAAWVAAMDMAIVQVWREPEPAA